MRERDHDGTGYRSVAFFTQPVWDVMPIQGYGHGTQRNLT